MTRRTVAASLAVSLLLIGGGALTAARVMAQERAKAETAQVKQILKERAATLQNIVTRMTRLSAANIPVEQRVRPEELFQAKTAAAFAAAEAVDTAAEKATILTQLLADATAYEKLVADSIRANPAQPNDLRGQAERQNALDQLKLGRLDIALAIERLKSEN